MYAYAVDPPRRAAFSFFIRRDFLRAAAFLWITPLAAVLSMIFRASFTAAIALFASVCIATSAFLIKVFMRDLAAWLRNRRSRDFLISLIDDLMFATLVYHLPLLYCVVSVCLYDAPAGMVPL